MRRLMLLALLPLTASLPLSFSATAQTSAGTTATADLHATGLTGREVQFPSGDRIGWVEELIISADGQVRFVVVALSASAEMTAVPWAAIEFPNEGNAAVLKLDRQQLTEAPTFSREELAETGTDGWQAAVRNFYAGDRKPATSGLADFGQLDRDGNGRLTPGEMAALELPGVDVGVRFETADQNGDGVLDRTEFGAFRDGLLPESRTPGT